MWQGMFVYLPSLQRWIKQGLVKPESKDEKAVEDALKGSDSSGSASHTASPKKPSSAAESPKPRDDENGDRQSAKDLADNQPGPSHGKGTKTALDDTKDSSDTALVSHICPHGAIDPRAWNQLKIISVVGQLCYPARRQR